jgi:hypothetical protein
MKYEDIFNSLKEVVKKNHKTMRAFKVLVFNDKIDRRSYVGFDKWMRINKGISYMQKYNGFIVEEVEYREDKKIDSKSMIEEYLSKNKITKVDKQEEDMADIERMSRSHRSQYKNERKLREAKYDGIVFIDEEKMLKYKFKLEGFVDVKIKNSKGIKQIPRYRKETLTYTDYQVGRSIVVKESTIEEQYIGKYSLLDHLTFDDIERHYNESCSNKQYVETKLYNEDTRIYP